MTLELFIARYGYAAIALGMFVEGETLLLLGGFFAQQGELGLPGVLAAAVLGALSCDHLVFRLGRHHSLRYFEARPRHKVRIQRILDLLHDHRLLLLLGYRFLYGLRTLVPALLATTPVRYRAFALFSGIGTLAWAGFYVTLGYLFGHSLDALLHQAEHYQTEIATLFAGLGLIAVLIRGLRLRRAARRAG